MNFQIEERMLILFTEGLGCTNSFFETVTENTHNAGNSHVSIVLN